MSGFDRRVRQRRGLIVEDDFDLEGLAPAQAREYVASFMAAHRQTRQQLEDAEQDLAAWKKRAGLAMDKGDTALAREAVTRAEEMLPVIGKLKKEVRDLDFKVLELKRRLKQTEQEPRMSVDAKALLEQMESIVGTDHETDHAIAEAEAETALEALKRKMESESEE
jgi:phage shock protein A